MKLSKHTIGVIAIAVVLALGIGGSFVINNNVDPLTKQLGVKDPVVSKSGVETPYSLSKEGFEKAIKEDKYLNDKFNMEHDYLEEVTNLDNREMYKVIKQYSLQGKDKNDGDTVGFNAAIETYNNFKNPNTLMLIYRYKDDAEVQNINSSIKGIVGRLFNQELAKFIISKPEETFTTNVKSKSGEYQLTITKGIETYQDAKKMMVLIKFDTTEPEEYSIEAYKTGDELAPMYEKLEIFKGVDIKDLPKKYSDILGNYKDTRIGFVNNMTSKSGSYREDSSAINIRTIYEDDSATAIELYMQTKSDASNNIIEGQMMVRTVTRYMEDTKEILEEAVRVTNSLIGTKVELTSEDIEKGVLKRELTQNIAGYDFKFMIEIAIETDEIGKYGNILIIPN